MKLLAAACRLSGFRGGGTRGENQRDGVVVRASALQSIDLGFVSQVESYQKTLKNGIHSFPIWRSAQ